MFGRIREHKELCAENGTDHQLTNDQTALEEVGKGRTLKANGSKKFLVT